MSNTLKIGPVAALAAVLVIAPTISSAVAAPAESPSPSVDAAKGSAKGAKDSKVAPAPTGGMTAPAKTDRTRPADKRSNADSPEFLNGYRSAYAAIYERADYPGAIRTLQALGHDDRADVANLIGYSYRKLGNWEEARAWYERALRADPNHVKTWQYYGLWQVERGNRDKAMEHLNKIGSLCGFTCPEYQSLGEALATSSADY